MVEVFRINEFARVGTAFELRGRIVRSRAIDGLFGVEPVVEFGVPGEASALCVVISGDRDAFAPRGFRLALRADEAVGVADPGAPLAFRVAARVWFCFSHLLVSLSISLDAMVLRFAGALYRPNTAPYVRFFLAIKKCNRPRSFRTLIRIQASVCCRWRDCSVIKRTIVLIRLCSTSETSIRAATASACRGNTVDRLRAIVSTTGH